MTYSRDDLYTQLRSLFSEQELNLAIQFASMDTLAVWSFPGMSHVEVYEGLDVFRKDIQPLIKDFDATARAYERIMASPLAYAFLAEYAPPIALWEVLGKNRIFTIYIDMLRDVEKTFSYFCDFPVDDDAMSMILYLLDKTVWGYIYGSIMGGELAHDATIFGITQSVERHVACFYTHSTLLRTMVAEVLFHVRPFLPPLTLERSRLKLLNLLRDMGYEIEDESSQSDENPESEDYTTMSPL